MKKLLVLPLFLSLTLDAQSVDYKTAPLADIIFDDEIIHTLDEHEKDIVLNRLINALELQASARSQTDIEKVKRILTKVKGQLTPMGERKIASILEKQVDLGEKISKRDLFRFDLGTSFSRIQGDQKSNGSKADLESGVILSAKLSYFKDLNTKAQLQFSLDITQSEFVNIANNTTIDSPKSTTTDLQASYLYQLNDKHVVSAELGLLERFFYISPSVGAIRMNTARIPSLGLGYRFSIFQKENTRVDLKARYDYTLASISKSNFDVKPGSIISTGFDIRYQLKNKRNLFFDLSYKVQDRETDILNIQERNLGAMVGINESF